MFSATTQFSMMRRVFSENNLLILRKNEKIVTLIYQFMHLSTISHLKVSEISSK